MEFFDVVKARYSSRAYKSDPVEKEKLDLILEAARLAPTAVNKQPFKIAVIDTRGKENELKKIYNKQWFVQAPLILGVIACTDKSWVRQDKKNYCDVDASIVADHMILAATALGLGTCWIANFNEIAAKEFLKLEDNSIPVIFSPLGYAKDTPTSRVRKPIGDLVFYV